MFGQPSWFREKKFGWGLVPVTWQGWGYAAIWSGVLIAPFMLLVGRHLAFEALIWLGASVSMLLWDVRQILRAKRESSPVDDVLYIGDEELVTNGVSTDRFDFLWRR